MTTRKSAPRTIKVSDESKKKLAKIFKCTERMVYKALCYECKTELARKIQHVARKEMGGWIEATVPEAEIFYDTLENGERLMRQYFNNGAVLEVSFKTGDGILKYRGEAVKRYSEVRITQIPKIQAAAKAMR